MKKINVFIAASADINADMMHIGDFINNLNYSNNEQTEFLLHKCYQNFLMEKLKDINELEQCIANADIYFLLLDGQIDEIVEQSFQLALKHFLKCKRPKINVCFKNTPQRNKEAMQFLDDVHTKHKQYPEQYTHIDSLKLKIFLQLKAINEIADNQVNTVDNDLLFYDKKILSLEHISSLNRSEEYSKIKNQIKELQLQIISKKKQQTLLNDDSEEYYALGAQINQIYNSLKKTKAEKYQYEKNVFKIEEEYLKQDKKELSERMIKAKQYLDQGELQKAINIFNLDDIQEEVNEAVEQFQIAVAQSTYALANCQHAILSKIDECFTKIRNLNLLISDQKRFVEMKKIHELALQFEENLNEILVNNNQQKEQSYFARYEYADFLYFTLNDYSALQYYLEVVQILDMQNKQASSDYIGLLNRIGSILSAQDKTSEAEKIFIKAMVAFENIDEPSDEILNRFSITLNNLSSLYVKTYRHEKAEEIGERALKIQKDLSESSNLEFYVMRYARTLDGLAYIQKVLDKHEASKKNYLEALRIRKEAAQEDSYWEDEYIPSLISVAELYEEEGLYLEAEELLLESCQICEKLNQENPFIYRSQLANVYWHLSDAYSLLNKYDKAMDYIKKALRIRKILFRENNDLYASEYIEVLQTYARYLFINGETTEARTIYATILQIAVKLKEFNPAVYTEKYAIILMVYASLIEDFAHEEANTYYHRAIGLFEELAMQSNNLQSNYVTALKNYGYFLFKNQEYKKALTCYKKALLIFLDLLKKNPLNYASTYIFLVEQVAILLDRLGQSEEAKKYYLEAISMGYSLAKQRPLGYADVYIETLRQYNHFLSRHENYIVAEKICETMASFAKKMYEQMPAMFLAEYSHAIENLADIKIKVQKEDEAELNFLLCLDLAQELLVLNANRYKKYYGLINQFVGKFYYWQKKTEKAGKYYAVTLEICKECMIKDRKQNIYGYLCALYDYRQIFKDENNYEMCDELNDEIFLIIKELLETASNENFSEYVYDILEMVEFYIRYKQINKIGTIFSETLQIINRECFNEIKIKQYAAINDFLYLYAKYLKDQQQYDIAAKISKESIAILDKVENNQSKKIINCYAKTYAMLASVAVQLGNKQITNKCYTVALQKYASLYEYCAEAYIRKYEDLMQEVFLYFISVNDYVGYLELAEKAKEISIFNSLHAYCLLFEELTCQIMVSHFNELSAERKNDIKKLNEIFHILNDLRPSTAYFVLYQEWIIQICHINTFIRDYLIGHENFTKIILSIYDIYRNHNRDDKAVLYLKKIMNMAGILYEVC